MYYIRDIIIKKYGIFRDTIIRTLHGKENISGFVIPNRNDIITIVGDDGLTHVLSVKRIEYDYDTYWHNRDGAIEITVHCR